MAICVNLPVCNLKKNMKNGHTETTQSISPTKDLNQYSAKDFIIIKGARQHNLKNIDVVIPRNKMVVITGLSGSGKSSLAFDTLYAEGQ